MDNQESFLTADEARKVSQHTSGPTNLNQLKSIDENIKLACSVNQFYIYEYITLSTSVINHLKNRGFSIENLSSQREGTCYKITW